MNEDELLEALAALSRRKPLIQLLRPTARVPERSKPEDAGMDLFADLSERGGEIVIGPGVRELIPTGVAIQPPRFSACLFFDKSGRAWNDGLHVMGGVCDRPYTGEYFIILLNTDRAPRTIKHGEKVCQFLTPLLLLPQDFEVVEKLPETRRGAGGFGSTGLE